MTLFEVLLSVAVFGLAAVALVEALNNLGLAAIESRHETAALEQMRSLLDEYGKASQVRKLAEEFPENEMGISYLVMIQPVTLKNQDGAELSGLFEVLVQAQWMEEEKPQKLEARTYRYENLYR